MAEAIEVVSAEWARIAGRGPDRPKSWRTTKTYLTGSYPLRFDGNGPIASILVGMQMDGVPDRLCHHPQRQDRGGDDGGHPARRGPLVQSPKTCTSSWWDSPRECKSRLMLGGGGSAALPNNPLPPAGPLVYQFPMRWTIPNSLTVLRLLAAPGVAIMFLYFHRPWADWFALTLFVGAALTDWFDGYLARLWKQESKFGAMMDPIADKAMVVIAIMVHHRLQRDEPLADPARHGDPVPRGVRGRAAGVSGRQGRASEGDEAGQVEDHRADGGDCGAVPGHRAGIPERRGDAGHDARTVYRGRRRAGLADPIRACGNRDCASYANLVGIWLLWLAALLTVVTGWEYFSKSLPFLRDDK